MALFPCDVIGSVFCGSDSCRFRRPPAMMSVDFRQLSRMGFPVVILNRVAAIRAASTYGWAGQLVSMGFVPEFVEYRYDDGQVLLAATGGRLS